MTDRAGLRRIGYWLMLSGLVVGPTLLVFVPWLWLVNR